MPGTRKSLAWLSLQAWLLLGTAGRPRPPHETLREAANRASALAPEQRRDLLDEVAAWEGERYGG